MASLTAQEAARWRQAYEAARAARRQQCSSPVTPSNPVQPRTPGQFIGSLRWRGR